MTKYTYLDVFKSVYHTKHIREQMYYFVSLGKQKSYLLIQLNILLLLAQYARSSDTIYSLIDVTFFAIIYVNKVSCRVIPELVQCLTMIVYF